MATEDRNVSDDELAALALAADPDAPLEDDARPLWEIIEGTEPGRPE